MNEPVERKEKKKKRRARGALLRLRAKLRSTCTSFRSADEWYQALEPLVEWLRDYGQLLSPEQATRLRQAMRLTDTGRLAISRACQVLDTELGRAIQMLPVPAAAALGPWIAGIVLVVAVVVGGLVVYRRLNRVEVVVRNSGCEAIAIQGRMPEEVNMLIQLLGVDPPDYVPQDGEVAFSIGVFPMTFNIENRGGSIVALSGDLAVVLFETRPGMTVVLDGVPLGAQPLNLHQAEQHTLELHCR
ncbi:MAG: hypothetical protein H5T69_10310 [Chloroflexi bacterium]|nr:hypothetical protein [Chloroflexota bacterium]